ncbi:MAG: DUF2061 domain-containing protein [Firmicutes bacterium]|nr:DUF2061 domain-containing protein [Bacillota bacterium]
MINSKTKKLLKTLSWRITATSTTLLLVYILSGELKIAGTVALLEVIVKTLIYYIHETAWEKVQVLELD